MTHYNVPGWTIPTTAAVWQGWKGVNTVAFWVFVVVMTGCASSFLGNVASTWNKNGAWMRQVQTKIDRCELAQRQQYGRFDYTACRSWAVATTPRPE